MMENLAAHHCGKFGKKIQSMGSKNTKVREKGAKRRKKKAREEYYSNLQGDGRLRPFLCSFVNKI